MAWSVGLDAVLIPAHAGVILSGTDVGREGSAYPRARGGDPPGLAAELRLDGLSPRTRG